MKMKRLEQIPDYLSISATKIGEVIGINLAEHMFSMFSFHALHPPSCIHKHSSPVFKVLQRIGDKILTKNGERLHENLSRETIFFATTLRNT